MVLLNEQTAADVSSELFFYGGLICRSSSVPLEVDELDELPQ